MAAARTMHARGIPLRHITHQCGRSGFSKRLLASMTKVNVDLSNGMWLLNLSAQMPEFAQPITVRPGPDAPIEGHCMWLTRSLKGKGLFGPGFYPILSAGKFPADMRTEAEWTFLNGLAHKHTLLLQLRERLGLPADTARDHLAVLGVMAAHRGLHDTAKTFFYHSSKRDESKISVLLDGSVSNLTDKAVASLLAPHIKAVGSALEAAELQDVAEPMLNSPFHRALHYLDASALVSIATETAFGSKYDQNKVKDILARHKAGIICTLDALADMIFADGKVNDNELGALSNVIYMARLTDTEQEDLQYNLFKRQHNAGVMKQSEVAKNFGKQAANRLSQLSEEDAAAIKPFLYLQILIHMLLDGDGVNTDNDAFIEGFVQAAGLKPDDCIELEVQAEGFLASNPGLVEAYSWDNVAKRLQHRLSVACYDACMRYKKFLELELNETQELMSLLAKRAVSELTEEEQRKITQQVTDIAKAVPALALFCVPGGSVLLPAIMQVLDLRPSSVKEHQDGPGAQ